MDLRFTAIDPLALILRSDIYIILHLPDPPPPDVLRENVRAAVKGMTADERIQALARLRGLKTYAEALGSALGEVQAQR
jgi:hypothetical protein